MSATPQAAPDPEAWFYAGLKAHLAEILKHRLAAHEESGPPEFRKFVAAVREYLAAT